MNILIIGSGGREHAIARAIRKSKDATRVIVAPGNPGIEFIGECIDIDVNCIADILEVCRNYDIDFIIIGPENPIAEGFSDELRLWGYVVFAPSRYAAQLESSKVFAKQFMEKYNIPTAKYAAFDRTDLDETIEYIKKIDTQIVLKADGLAAGKGVVVTDDKDYAIQSLKDLFEGKFGEAGYNVIIEEFLEGEEASVLAICDGENFICLPPAQDFKRIGENNTGKNTGGMGAYCPVSIVDSDVLDKIKNKIIIPTLEGIKSEGDSYIGCLYVGLMIKDGEPKVVEFNCRFGDPETQVVLSVFEGNLLELLYTTAKGKININAYNEKATMQKSACCVVLASEGYPDNYETGYVIKGLSEVSNNQDDLIAYHSGTKKKMTELLTAGGRVLGVTAIKDNIADAVKKVYDSVNKISFENIYYRKDIAQKEVERMGKK